MACPPPPDQHPGPARAARCTAPVARGLLLLAMTATCSSPVMAEWKVPEAPIRFQLAVTSAATHAAAGVIVILPDGGILPTQHATPIVLDATTGDQLRHEGLWHNRNEGLALVTETGHPLLDVYVRPSAVPYPVAPNRLETFKPSLLFYYTRGNAGLETAHALSKQAAIGTNFLFAQAPRIYETDPPVGRNGNGSSYYCGWLASPTNGAAYLYSISKAGSAFAVNGETLHSWPGEGHKRGGEAGEHGEWVTLTHGIHRIEYFHYNIDGRAIFHLDPGGREVHLGWQPPRPDLDEVPPADRRYERGATRPMRADEFVHSGRAAIVGAETRSGSPALFEPSWEAYIQTGTNILCLYRLAPLLPAREDTRYLWTFGTNATVSATNTTWLFAGRGDRKVRLTTLADRRLSRMTRTFFPKRVPPASSIKDPATRARFRAAFLAQCRAIPPLRSPADHWPPEMWTHLVDVSDPGRGAALMDLLRRRAGAELATLPAPRRHRVEDAIGLALRTPGHAKEMLRWLVLLRRDEADPERRADLGDLQLRMLIHDLAEPGAARLIADNVLRNNNETPRARIHALSRLAELDLYAANVNRALPRLGNANALARKAFHPNISVHGRRFKRKQLAATFHRAMDEMRTADAWYLLGRWEVGFPMSRVQDDFLLAESAWLEAVGRTNQARRVNALIEQLGTRSPARPSK